LVEEWICIRKREEELNAYIITPDGIESFFYRCLGLLKESSIPRCGEIHTCSSKAQFRLQADMQAPLPSQTTTNKINVNQQNMSLAAANADLQRIRYKSCRPQLQLS
jgi:hypothetical protein